MADVLDAEEEAFEDDKQDNDSGIQKDEKDNEVEEEEKKEQSTKKKKPKIKIRGQSPQKLQQRNRDGSPKKLLQSPVKSPKKRKRREPKQSKEKILSTVVRNENFDPKRSALKLRKAMGGINTDEKMIIEIFCSHTYDQREKIQAAYNRLAPGAGAVLHGSKDLISDLKEQLGGLFCELMQGLITDPLRFETISLQDMVAKFEPNLGFEKSFISVLALKSRMDLQKMRLIYKMDFDGANMDEEVMSKLQGVEGYDTLVAALLTQERDSDQTAVDVEAARLVAQKLGENGIGGSVTPRAASAKDPELDKVEEGEEEEAQGEEEKAKEERAKEDLNSLSDLDELLFCRSVNQVKETLKEYEATAMVDMDTSVKMEFSEIKAEAYSSLIERLVDPSLYYAKELDEAIQGLGSDDETIIRIFVSRCEVDLRAIEEKYKEFSGRNLKDAIEQDTGGDYTKMLLKLLNPESKILTAVQM